MLVWLAAQVGLEPLILGQPRVWSVSIDDVFKQNLAVWVLWISPFDEGAPGSSQLVILGSEGVPPAIPGIDRLAHHIIEHPPLAGIYTDLVNLVAEHVKVIGH